MPDAFLDVDVIRASTFVRYVEIHDSLGSTNDRAAELAVPEKLHRTAEGVAVPLDMFGVHRVISKSKC